jgi:dolichol-phosphate mannosyltransferase
VIPTYNERDNLPAIEAALRETVPDVHLAVVDDNSPDGTGEIGDRLAAARPGAVHVIHRSGKQGLGTAYVAGFRRVLELGYSRIVQMDCDFSHDPARVPVLLGALDEDRGADLVVGSRYVPGGGTANWGLIRETISRTGSRYARTVLGLRYRDLTAGFKAWRREALEAIPLDRVAAQGYCFQIEMTYRAHLLGLRIREVPIVFVDRRVGQSKMSRRIVLEAMMRCWALRRELGAHRNGASR